MAASQRMDVVRCAMSAMFYKNSISLHVSPGASFLSVFYDLCNIISHYMPPDPPPRQPLNDIHHPHSLEEPHVVMVPPDMAAEANTSTVAKRWVVRILPGLYESSL